MSNIIINAGASFDYPLKPDNVFGSLANFVHASGGLSSDANGGGAGDAVFFATLSRHSNLSITDLTLV